ncbi:MAG: ABC transporter permease [Rhodospirillaceae bacterium]|nr:ABC transporter permease [Rhodospirillaceae bacterium]
MIAFVIRRLLQGVIVMLTVALIAFVLFNFVGDPVAGMVGQDTSIEDRAKLRQELGLNDPIYIRFARFVGNGLEGDFGKSYRTAQPVGEMIAVRLPATLELSFVAALFALAMAVPMGVFSGLYPRHWFSRVLQAVSLIGISLPTFLVGILLILIFAVGLNLLPAFGRGEVVDLGGWTTGFLSFSGLKALILPSITLGLFQLTLIMRLVRAEMLEVLRTDYIKFARARGLRNRTVNFHHALKNTLVPVITVTGLQLGQLIAFAIVTETVFSWPGVGQLFIQSVYAADIPVMAAYLTLIALVFVFINLVVDLLYYAVDPRLRTAQAAARVS